MSQLRSLPFDRIKIDRSFVTSLPGNPESATIVQSIVSLGEGLGLPITAEGIENEEVLAELLSYGKFKGQGYLYGRPATAEATGEELAQLDLLLEIPEQPTAEAARGYRADTAGLLLPPAHRARPCAFPSSRCTASATTSSCSTRATHACRR